MKMFFKDSDMITIMYGADSWRVKKQIIADYLSQRVVFEPHRETLTLEKAVVLTYLPFTHTISIYEGNQDYIEVRNMQNIKMEVSKELKKFLISSK